VQPVIYMVETQPPDSGFHPQASRPDPIVAGTDYLLVLVVIVIGAARMIVRLIKIPARP